MLKIINNNQEYDFSFNGIKVLDSSNSTKLYKDLFLNAKIYINDTNFKSENVLYINELSLKSSFIDLSKKSFIVQTIIDKLSENSVINQHKVDNIVQLINNELEYEILESSDGDQVKIIQLLFDVLNDGYVDESFLELLLNRGFEESKLIIFDNVSWLNIDTLSRYLNEHHFIILTNDFRQFLRQKNDLELVTIFQKNNDYTELLDVDKVCAYIEKHTSDVFDNLNFAKFINESNSIFSAKIFQLIKNI